MSKGKTIINGKELVSCTCSLCGADMDILSDTCQCGNRRKEYIFKELSGEVIILGEYEYVAKTSDADIEQMKAFDKVFGNKDGESDD